MDKRPCQDCGKMVAPYESVNLGSSDGTYRNVCMSCCNADIAKRAGLVFNHPDFLPLKLTDKAGVEHRFHFTTRLLGDKVAIDGFEVRDDGPTGYRLMEISDDPEGDMMVPFKHLLNRLQQALARRHIKKDRHGWQVTKPGIVRGYITSDCGDDDSKPVVVIDGQELDWDTFGRLVLSHEGWQFKVEFYDMSQDR